MIQVTALRRGNSVGKGRMFCAEYDPGHDARQPVAADRIVCCPCAAQPGISAALQHGGYADRRPFPRRRGAGGRQFVRTADFPAHQLLCGRNHGRTISRYFGAGDHDRVSRAIHTNILVSMCSGILLTVCGVAFTPTILRWMGTDPEVLPEAISYFRYYFTGVLAVVLYNA